MAVDEPRTREEVEAARLNKAEDFLAFDMALIAAGQAPIYWPRYFDPETGAFKADAKSANHKAMAALAAAVAANSKAARAYWMNRLRLEIEGRLGLGEARSNKYAHWSLGALALFRTWAAERGDSEAVALADRVYVATIISWALGSTAEPARNLVAGKWGGCYISAPGVRSDPGHLEGDPRAFIVQTELWPVGTVKDRYRDNAERRAKGAKGDTPQGRKHVSELWWRDAIVKARKAGLQLPAWLVEVLAAMMQSTALTEQDDRALVGYLSPVLPGCEYRFHFTCYADGTRVNWLEDSRANGEGAGERCLFGDRIKPFGAVEVLFPYTTQKNSRGGSCRVEGERLVARAPDGGVAFLELPEGEPLSHLIWGPQGLEAA